MNNVPLSEFDQEELSTMLRLLASCKNIGAGKTELVISKILFLLTSLLKDKTEESGRNFRLKFGERAINETIDILLRNQARSIDHS